MTGRTGDQPFIPLVKRAHLPARRATTFHTDAFASRSVRVPASQIDATL